MIIDTHCHYNMEPLFANWKQHWQKAQAHGVKKAVVVGADLISSQRAIEIAQTEPNLYAAIGIHPEEINKIINLTTTQAQTEIVQQVTALKKMSLDQPKVVAIGETGLDYFYFDKEDKNLPILKQRQAELFQSQIELANELQLPLIVHVRDREIPEAPTIGNAYWDALQIIKARYQFFKPFILHCVYGPLKYVQAALELGAYIGVAGNVTYKNAHHLRELVKTVPADRLLVETDAPFLPPVPYRGQVCEPWMIKETDDYLTNNLNQNRMLGNAQFLFGQL